MINGGHRKRQRLSHNAATANTATANTATSRQSSTAAVLMGNRSNVDTGSIKSINNHSPSSGIVGAAKTGSTVFNDAATADVSLRLFVDPTDPFDSHLVDCSSHSDVHVYLHSEILGRSKYFSALLSDRWITQTYADTSCEIIRLNLSVAPTPGAMESHLTVLELLYTNDFSNTIHSASIALDLLPVALELLFEDCVKSCVKFLEAVPWTEEEEKRVLNLIPFLREKESAELLARVSPLKENSCEEMFEGLISSVINNHPNTAYVKAFVAKLLRDFSSKDSAKRVLERAFDTSLKIVKESLEEYSKPEFRGNHNETEAIQRLNLHTAMTNARHLLWLVERMIELRVADVAVKQWGEQSALTADLQRTFGDDAWRNIVAGLPGVILRCTCKLANAVAAGTILVSRDVRKKLVEDWLPVLIICKDKVLPVSLGNKSLYMELEETFLRIISTLPMSEALDLLNQCLSFSTRNVEDCPHLVTAFNTWFRRAMRPSMPG